MKRKTNYLKRLIEDFNKRQEEYKKLPDMTPDLVKKFYDQEMEVLYQIELENKLSDKTIKFTKIFLNETFSSFTEKGLLQTLENDSTKTLNYYRNEVKSGNRKSDIFQQLIIGKVYQTNKLLYFRISHFGDLILKTYKKNPYASLILLRSNIENLALYYFYINEIEKLFNKEKWLDIIRLNLRILYSKQNKVKTNSEKIYQIKHQDMVELFVTMYGGKDKPIHISDCINYLLKAESKKNINFLNEIFKTPILKDYLNKNERVNFQHKCIFSQNSYDRLCEIVHPVAIEKNLYPFENDDPNVKEKFAGSYISLTYACTLFIQGINIYERMRGMKYKKINVIEKNLSDSFYKLRVKSDLEYIDKKMTSNSISEQYRDFLKNAKQRYEKEKL